MSSKYAIGNEGTVEEWTDEREERFEVVDETPELRPSVEQEIEATVDYADEWELEGRLFGQTFEAEERAAAREWEIERTKTRWDARQESDREGRTRKAVGRVSVERRRSFEKRTASVDPWMDPDATDARERLSRKELGTVNREAARLAGRLDGWSRAAISRRLAERIVDGAGVMSAVVGVFEELQTAPGQMIPIAAIEDVQRREVSIEGRVTQLWQPSHPKIAQVGLIEDESGRTKVTVWKRSNQSLMREGERVRLYDAARTWYEGRCSVALTGWSSITFPERGRWWE